MDTPPESPLRAADEFPAGAAESPTEVDRREFVKLMGASVALASAAGCARQVAGTIVPGVTAPDYNARGDVTTFATALPSEGFARGVVVTAHAGRPTKIEGNPDHSESLGATDVFMQAAVLSLYDPDRSKLPMHRGEPATWEEVDRAMVAQREEWRRKGGAGVALLLEPTTSPTLRRELARFFATFPAATWYQHTALGRYDRDGAQNDYDFARADVILTIQSDALYRHPAALRYGRAFAQRRRVENGRVNAPRFYAIEPTPSVTGSLADFHLGVGPSRIRAILDALAATIEGRETAGELNATERKFVAALARDLRASLGQAVAIAGVENDPDVQTWAEAFNARFGAQAATRGPAVRSDGDARSGGGLAELAAAIQRGEVRALFVLGANPVQTSARASKFAEQMRRVPLTVHLGEHVDETGALAQWHLPQSHALESWGDLRGYDGSTVIQQPLIDPLYRTRSVIEVVRLLTGPTGLNGFDLVQETWREQAKGDDFESQWQAALKRGVIEEAAARGQPITVSEVPAFPRLVQATVGASLLAASAPTELKVASKLAPTVSDQETVEVVFQPDPNVLDGRWSNNAWLQELPKPITQLVWDNAAFVSAAWARAHSLENGDVIELADADRRLEAPIWTAPGQADNVITLTLGYGRARAGRVGNDHGYDAFQLQNPNSPWRIAKATVRKTGRVQTLVSTQDHFLMEGRDPVRVVVPDDAGKSVEEKDPQPTLFPSWKRGLHAWGMSIDLATCLGCNACVVACQAENNIPVVGKEQIGRHREMHWLRVVRYVAGPADAPQFFPQPVPCMQCENAPCEVVCPVGATVHSSEGLNDMVYNRCVGTRYCSNNCPYKVRRFNFFDYRAPRGSTVHLQENPAVTVRERGVMEKCTYCVQRINAGRIAAERENRPIRDGEIRTACQQACPAKAIVFGDLNDASSAVATRKAEPTSYSLLRELNTRPRTTYLAAVRQRPLA